MIEIIDNFFDLEELNENKKDNYIYLHVKFQFKDNLLHLLDKNCLHLFLNAAHSDVANKIEDWNNCFIIKVSEHYLKNLEGEFYTMRVLRNILYNTSNKNILADLSEFAPWK